MTIRRLRALALAAAPLLLCTAAIATAQVPEVDLDAPGVLARLAHANPDHHGRVLRILDGVAAQPERDVPRWILVNFGGRDARYAPIVLTSHPAQRRLAFTLDTTRYRATVWLTAARYPIVPASRP